MQRRARGPEHRACRNDMGTRDAVSRSIGLEARGECGGPGTVEYRNAAGVKGAGAGRTASVR